MNSMAARISIIRQALLSMEVAASQEALAALDQIEDLAILRKPVAEIHHSHLTRSGVWCKEVLLYSADNPGDGPQNRVNLYIHPWDSELTDSKYPDAVATQTALDGPLMHAPSGMTFDRVIAAVEPKDLIPLTVRSVPPSPTPPEAIQPCKGPNCTATWQQDSPSHSLECVAETALVQRWEFGEGVNLPLFADAVRKDMIKEMALPTTKAAKDILAERQRQVTEEGWTMEHDDSHIAGDLATAAACYITQGHVKMVPRPQWPWADAAWKPKTRRENLVRAAALLIAEVERLDRSDLRASRQDPTYQGW